MRFEIWLLTWKSLKNPAKMGGKVAKEALANITDHLPQVNGFHCAMVGLDSAGKTTVLYRLKFNQYMDATSTISFNCEKVRRSRLGKDSGAVSLSFAFVCFSFESTVRHTQFGMSAVKINCVRYGGATLVVPTPSSLSSIPPKRSGWRRPSSSLWKSARPDRSQIRSRCWCWPTSKICLRP